MASIAARIFETAAKLGDATAIEVVRSNGLDQTTFRQLAERAGLFARWLEAHGIGRGDRLAILADNDASWIAVYLGTLRTGAIAVPLDTAYAARQVAAVLQSSGARLLVTTPRYVATARAGAAAASKDAVRVVLMSGAETDADVIDWAGAGPGRVPPLADVGDTDPAVILYTSGTTADPKGVVLTHANLDAERLGIFSVIDVDEHDAVLGVLPLFHALAQVANLLLPLVAGARVVFLETVSATSLLQALEARGITILACVPQFFYLIHQRVMGEVAKAGVVSRVAFRAMLRTNGWLREHLGANPGRRWFARVHRVLGSRMRLLVTGGSTFDPGIGRDLYGLGFVLLNAYGLTETTGGATIVRPTDRFTSSVGQPLPGVEIKIRSASAGEDAGFGATSGEICIRGPIVMREYFNRPDATRESLKDGWLHTGDLGRLDSDGRLYITGRLKEIIVLSSGKNLYPEEIEAHYRQSAFIKELCVLGLNRPGEPAAERLHAVIVPDQDQLRARGIVNVRELVRFEVEGASVHLPPHKRILTYEIQLDALPRTTTGKLRRHEIARRLAEHAAVEETVEARPVSDADAAWLAEPEHAALVEALSARMGGKRVRPDANLELDLGLDSMERVELLTSLEQRQGTRVAPETRATIFTVRQLVDAVRAGVPAADGDGFGAPHASELPWDTVLGGKADPDVTANLTDPKRIRVAVFVVVLKTFALGLRLLIRLRAKGREHLPALGPFIISPNHQSFLDGFVLSAVLPARTIRQLFFVGDAALFAPPMMRRLGRSINMVAVDPDANLVEAMKAGAAGLRLKKVLILFPEGERTIDGRVRTFRKGAAILSSHLDAPVVPVALTGLYELWPRERPFNWRGLLPWRATPVTIEFGAPIVVTRGAYAEGTAEIRSAVAGMLERGSADRPAG